MSDILHSMAKTKRKCKSKIVLNIEHFTIKNTHFYCVNTYYSMNNCYTKRRDQSYQMTEKVVL